MESEDAFDRLTEAGVLVEEVEGRVHRVGVADSFRNAVDDVRDSLDEQTVRETALMDLIANPEAFFELGDRALDFAALALALADAIENTDGLGEDFGRDPDTATLSEFVPGSALVLEHVMNGYPRTAGSPDGFFSIGGDQLELALACFDRVVLFVWRDDCPTCDSMAAEMEALLDAREPSVPLLSLFGPDATEKLHGDYDVFGAPTTLFIRNSEVEARLLGSRHKEAIASEIDLLIGDR